MRIDAPADLDRVAVGQQPCDEGPEVEGRAKAFIGDRLVLEAKRLLLHTQLPASAVADRLGFSSTTVFTRFFRHRTSETPLGFRRRARRETQRPPEP
ncbi:helix-turn-helix domain-containing protein [Streptomyces sp. NPDC017086]|uniref:helix-turn-helix domain-containing protein n=1 Tax=Streptomyces sp. NPDC017086 TaxID=3364976 RepID=UPI00378E6A44